MSSPKNIHTPIQEQIKHLKSDPVLNQIIAGSPEITDLLEQDVYLFLLRSIISQQLYVKAAAVINSRFFNLFPENKPNPERILEFLDEDFRSIGLSRQKSGYIKNVALFKLDGKLEQDQIRIMDDEELIQHLTIIKGVGRWTAEMILIFSLNRPNIFPADDLGIQNAMKKHYELAETGKELKSRMNAIAANWKPYCSLASRYLWQSLNNF